MCVCVCVCVCVCMYSSFTRLLLLQCLRGLLILLLWLKFSSVHGRRAQLVVRWCVMTAYLLSTNNTHVSFYMTSYDLFRPSMYRLHILVTMYAVNVLIFIYSCDKINSIKSSQKQQLCIQIGSLTWHVLAETWDGIWTWPVSGLRHVEVSRLKRVASAPLLVKVTAREIVWPTTCKPKSMNWLSTSS